MASQVLPWLRKYSQARQVGQVYRQRSARERLPGLVRTAKANTLRVLWQVVSDTRERAAGRAKVGIQQEQGFDECSEARDLQILCVHPECVGCIIDEDVARPCFLCGVQYRGRIRGLFGTPLQYREEYQAVADSENTIILALAYRGPIPIDIVRTIVCEWLLPRSNIFPICDECMYEDFVSAAFFDRAGGSGQYKIIARGQPFLVEYSHYDW